MPSGAEQTHVTAINDKADVLGSYFSGDTLYTFIRNTDGTYVTLDGQE